MPKRPARENPNERKSSADLTDEPKKKRNRKKSEEYVMMINPDDEPDEQYQEFIEELLESLEEKPKKPIQPAMHLSPKEMKYFKALTNEMKIEFNSRMESLKKANIDSDIPLKFRVLTLNVPDYVKTNVLKKVSAIEDDNGETYKLRNWVDAFLRIPFDKTIPLPVKLEDGKEKCSEFMRESRTTMDKAVFGMVNAKTQIMQVLSQWIANPGSVGNVIALQGPAGVGKTSIARNGIAKALHRPFEFFSLGGASDISTYTGHSYTYEGSMWGRIAEALMHSKCMNPVMYFDELDKISTTAQGEEIVSMLIHLTDRSQNTQFHDRYFSGIDFDVSQCLFVFSFNDTSLVNPILRDRMQIIHCSGYTPKEKQSILREYVWPDLLDRLRFLDDDIELTDDACKFLVSEYSAKEEGVRTLIRTAEIIVTRLNMLRIADEDTMKDYAFFIKVDFPLKLSEQIIRKLLCDAQAKDPEPWRSMYN